VWRVALPLAAAELALGMVEISADFVKRESRVLFANENGRTDGFKRRQMSY